MPETVNFDILLETDETRGASGRWHDAGQGSENSDPNGLRSILGTNFRVAARTLTFHPALIGFETHLAEK
jgi:hypothetical protein